ncbi:MAG: Tol-Pal system beta propeller repeat protein TolB [Gammaproteobacteria bacterium]|nr:Tol-Pal system beta propeller repeat protein TolB [Gammaproteobacteria bacterium]
MIRSRCGRLLPLLLGIAAAGALQPWRAAHAVLQIDITQGVSDPIPVAIVPFARAVPADGGFDVAALVQRDLEGSGRFRAMARRDMLAQPTRAGDVHGAAWHAAGNDYVVVGRVSSDAGALLVEFELVNVLSGQRLGGQRIAASAATLRNAAHRIADFVYEKILGTRGAFATRIAYVAVTGQPAARRYQLIVADADGDGARVVLDSRQPIMSPAWSADGQWLAYVSFENHASAVYVQRVRTGERRQVSARVGVNGAPAFSPDGTRLALTLSGSAGNLDIYVLELGTQQLTRITSNPAIDTEPAWAPDGRALYFTSDRAGGPQIYRVELADVTRVQRVSFGTAYNARPRLSADGRWLAFVTREDGRFRIAVQDLGSGSVRLLSSGSLDESPSFAPNGATLIYASHAGGRAALATVAIDGLVSQRLNSDQGDIREPVWGPFIP